MSQRYFDLAPEMTIPGRWSLGMLTNPQGRELDDPWEFTEGKPLSPPGRLLLPVTVPGRALDLSYGGLGTPVVHVRVAGLLTQLAPEDVQVFPVEVQGQPDQFCVLVATQLIRCIDDTACKKVEYWAPEDGQPEKVGEYRNVRGLRIDPSTVGDARVFRPWGWPVALIVREDIKNALEDMGATGMRFQEV